MKYFADIKNNEVVGYYIDEIHGDNIPEGVIEITEELWNKLLQYPTAILNEELNKEKLDIDDFNKFSIKQPEIIEEVSTKTMEELEEENIKLSKTLDIALLAIDEMYLMIENLTKKEDTTNEERTQ